MLNGLSIADFQIPTSCQRGLPKTAEGLEYWTLATPTREASARAYEYNEPQARRGNSFAGWGRIVSCQLHQQCAVRARDRQSASAASDDHQCHDVSQR